MIVDFESRETCLADIAILGISREKIVYQDTFWQLCNFRS
jgi:hypothetical protein